MSEAPRRGRISPLTLSVGDGLLHAVMVGVSESFLGVLAVGLGHGDTALALLATVPLLAGALSQLTSSSLAGALGGRKRLVVFGASLQAASTLLFGAIALTGTPHFAPLLLASAFYWITGTAIVPAWNAWIADLTRDIDRQRYFGRRSGLIQLVLVASFFLAGLALDRAPRGAVLATFASLFFVACLARAGSAMFLAWTPAAEEPASGPPEPPLMALAAAARSSRWRIATFYAALMGGAYLGVPFFTPYMLRVLALDYGAFAGLTALSIMSKAIAFALCHRAARRFGMRPLLATAGVGIAVVPAMWMGGPSMTTLAAAQVLGGVAWAGFEYASFQLLLESAPDGRRFQFLSLAASLTGFAQLAGALTGGLLLDEFGVGYDGVFFASTVGRGVSLVVLLAAVPKLPRSLRWPRLVMRIATVRPAGGAVQRPVLADRASDAALRPPDPRAPREKSR